MFNFVIFEKVTDDHLPSLIDTNRAYIYIYIHFLKISKIGISIDVPPKKLSLFGIEHGIPWDWNHTPLTTVLSSAKLIINRYHKYVCIHYTIYVPWVVEHKVGLSFWNHSTCTLSEVLNGGTLVMLFFWKKARSSAVAPTTAKLAPWLKSCDSPWYGGSKGTPRPSAAHAKVVEMITLMCVSLWLKQICINY